ncbi:RNA repair transcriptional activator RtcR family protein [Neomoorella thermoacetica]|uniref:RNA repair transcriptional activator RtcR family protein n=1 Tax=Neomoorella thermoacetica TaxID=1525 RepID=UPI0030D57433
MDVLLSFVGNQDPISEKTNEPGAVLTLCQEIKPEIVYLLPTAEGPDIASSTEANAWMTKDLMKDISPQSACYIRPLSLADPTDFQELLPCVKETVKRILHELQRNSQELKIHLNCSSGTPQMTACWYVLANSGFIPAAHLWQAHNPKMVAPEKRVREIRLNFLEEENILSRIYRCLPEYLFEVMAAECRELQNISLYSVRRSRAELMALIFKAYSFWDLLQYREAYQRLAAVERRWRNTLDAGEAADILNKQVAFLKLLEPEQEIETPENLVDIYYNAQRCLARQNYTDTLARFWRIHEGVVYYWLREKWGLEPQNLSMSNNQKNKDKALGFLSSRGFSFRSDRLVTINLHLASELLQKGFEDKEFGRIVQTPIKVQRANSMQEMKLADLLEELRTKRNNSLVAHGMKPVSREDAVNGLEAARTILTRVLANGNELLAAYPLQEENIRFLLRLLSES